MPQADRCPPAKPRGAGRGGAARRAGQLRLGRARPPAGRAARPLRQVRLGPPRLGLSAQGQERGTGMDGNAGWSICSDSLGNTHVNLG